MRKFFTLFLYISRVCTYGQSEDLKTSYKFGLEVAAIQDKQNQAFHLSMIGEYEVLLFNWEKAISQPYFNMNTFLSETIHTTPAIPYILDKAKAAEYVILNEAHHMPGHRVFARQLLKGLWKQGYRNLAIEALSTDSTYYDKELNTRKYPLVNSGYYSREPRFGNFIREALQMGYYVFPYDTGFELGGKEREEYAATTILERQQKGKTFVYCGFDHAAEGPSHFWEKALAEQLKQKSGKDPLSIDQTVFNASYSKPYEHPKYSDLASDQPVVLINKGQPYVAENEAGGYYDLTVVHPRPTKIKDRSSWLFAEDVQAVAINTDTIPVQRPYLLMAFSKDEDPNQAVPIDILQIDSNNSSPVVHLALPEDEDCVYYAVSRKEGQKKLN